MTRNHETPRPNSPAWEVLFFHALLAFGLLPDAWSEASLVFAKYVRPPSSMPFLLKFPFPISRHFFHHASHRSSQGHSPPHQPQQGGLLVRNTEAPLAIRENACALRDHRSHFDLARTMPSPNPVALTRAIPAGRGGVAGVFEFESCRISLSLPVMPFPCLRGGRRARALPHR